jgi:hypothetical protein
MFFVWIWADTLGKLGVFCTAAYVLLSRKRSTKRDFGKISFFPSFSGFSTFGRGGRDGEGDEELRRRFPIEEVISRWGFLEQYLHLQTSLPSPMSQMA